MLYPEAARIVREALKDKSYRAYPIGQEAGAYLRWKRGRIAHETYRTYESILDKFARHFPDLELRDFEPPVGIERIEEFLDEQWGGHAPGTYNLALTILGELFKWACMKGRIQGNPTLTIQRRKKGGVHHRVFQPSERSAILSLGPDDEYTRRDRICLRLLLDYGIRKGALHNIQFRHFDPNRKILTIFTKGSKVRDLPIVHADLWDDLAKLQFEIDAKPDFYLLHSRKRVFCGYDGNVKKFKWFNYHDRPFSSRGIHEWWYACLERAGVTEPGQTSGERMHNARHSAGQQVLDKTHGNIKAAQKLLGHESMQTTADIYVDWDIDALRQTLEEIKDV